MADDGWETVTDPSVIRKVMGAAAGGGKAKLSGAETKELAEARKANQEARDIFPALASTYRLASRYPGGVPNVAADSLWNTFGSYNKQVQDKALFDVQAQRAGIAQAKLLRPATDQDVKLAISSGANPSLRFENNQEIIGQDYEKSARAYFENAYKQRWAAKNGGLNAADKQGRSYAEGLAEAMRRPDVQKLLVAPWKRGGAPGGPTVASGWKVKR